MAGVECFCSHTALLTLSLGDIITRWAAVKIGGDTATRVRLPLP